MGNKSVKKKNELLDQQTKISQGLQNKMVGYGDEDRGYSVGARDDINSKYNSLYDELGAGDYGGGGGGGGGEVYTPQYEDARENAYAGDYRNWADTGGITDEFKSNRGRYEDLANNGGFDVNAMQDYRTRANAVLPAMYGGLRDQLTTANNAAGGNVGFNSQMAKLAREQAYGTNQVSANTEASLHDLVQGGKERGMSGLVDLEGQLRSGRQYGVTGGAGLDEGLIQRQMQVERERQSAAASAAAQRNANAGRGRANAEEGFRNRMAILNAQRELRGEAGSDLPYFNAAGGFGGQAANTINARQVEKSPWETAGSIAKGVGRGVAAFYSGGLSEAAMAGMNALKKKNPAGPAPSDDGWG